MALSLAQFGYFKRLEINRALAKIHLKKLEAANIVESRVVLVEGEAKALRYYKLKDIFRYPRFPRIIEEGGDGQWRLRV